MNGVVPDGAPGAVSFDLFGTLVTASRPDDPAEAISAALEARGVSVPDDWVRRFGRPQVARPEGAETPLPAHVVAALVGGDVADVDAAAAGRSALRDEVERAVRSVYDPEVRTRDGAVDAVERLAARRPVGVLSNCSVPGLAEQALERSALDANAFEAVTTSVGCGWRKPDPRAFRAVARGLGVDVQELVHVGDDPVADDGATDAGAAAVVLEGIELGAVPEAVEARWD
jgi:HAD superfamily hydrolase (TIGR01509 family)